MGAPAKFLFDLDFAAGSRRGPTVTLAEHATTLAAAEEFRPPARLCRGPTRRRGRDRPADRQHARRHRDRIAATGAALQAIEARLECEAVEVAVAVARKLAPNLIEREPFAEISALAAGCFRELVAAPHIVVRVNDGLYAAAREKIDDIARAQAFAGRLVVLGEPNVASGDCRIEWADGGVHRDAGAADRAIGEAVARYMSARRTFADAS